MTKKEKRERDKKKRVFFLFNMGERVHKSKRDYKRKKNWKENEDEV